MARKVRWLALLIALGVVAEAARPSCAADHQPTSSAAPALAGRYRFDREASDDASARMREVMEKRGGSGGGRPMGPGRGGGMSGHPGGGAPGPGRGGPPGMGQGDEGREAMRAVFEPADELVIVQSDDEITVDEKYGRARRLHPDGRKYKTQNGTAEIKSYWKDGRLVVETRSARGANLVETWERASDGARLTVLVRLEGGPGGKLELKRVYDRMEAESDGAPR